MGLLETFFLSAALSLGVQWVMATHAVLFSTEKLYDLTGAVTNISLVLRASGLWFSAAGEGRNFDYQLPLGLAFPRLLFPDDIPVILVVLWAARLGAFLFSRVNAHGEDRRFRRAKSSVRVMFIFWTMQALWTLVITGPAVAVGAGTDRGSGPTELAEGSAARPLFTAGAAAALLGLAVEALADHQKTRHRNDPRTSGTFVRTGLWRHARYANYAGEILFWAGNSAASAAILVARGAGFMGALPCVLPPVFTAYLLIKLSGVPYLERGNAKRYGDDPEYKRYVATTAKMIPYVW